MSLSSFPVSLSTDTSTPRSRDDLRASTVEAIVAVIDIPALFGDGSSPVNASEVERGLKGLMNDSCRAAMGEYIERLDDGRPTLLRDGEIWTRVPKTRNSIMTLFGKVTYERHRYRRAGSPSLVPVDERLHEHHGLLCCTPPRPPSRFESGATGIGSTVRLSRFSIAAEGGSVTAGISRFGCLTAAAAGFRRSGRTLVRGPRMREGSGPETGADCTDGVGGPQGPVAVDPGSGSRSVCAGAGPSDGSDGGDG